MSDLLLCSYDTSTNLKRSVHSLQNSHPKLKSQPIALQCISNWNTFVHLFCSGGKNNPFKNILPVFSCFSWFSQISLDFWGICNSYHEKYRFLGVQMSLLWVVFALKIVTLLWQPAKSWDIARECPSSTAICCLNVLIILIMITKGPQLIS